MRAAAHATPAGWRTRRGRRGHHADAGGPLPAGPARTPASRTNTRVHTRGGAEGGTAPPCGRPSGRALCARQRPGPRTADALTTVGDGAHAGCRRSAIRPRPRGGRRPRLRRAPSCGRSPGASGCRVVRPPVPPDPAQQAHDRRVLGRAIERDLDALGGPVGAGEPAVELPHRWSNACSSDRRDDLGQGPGLPVPVGHLAAVAPGAARREPIAGPRARPRESRDRRPRPSAAIPLRAPSSCSTYQALAPATWRSTASAVRAPVASSVGRGPCASSKRSTSAARASVVEPPAPRRTAAATSSASPGRRSHGKVALTS